MGFHILSSGLFGVIEGVVKNMCTFDNWNIIFFFKESYCIVGFSFFCLHFLLASATNSCLNVEDCNSYIYMHWTIVATTWRATKLETNNFKWWKQFVFLGTTYIKVEVWEGRYLFAKTLNSKLFCFCSKLFYSLKNNITQRKAIPR